MFLVKANTSMQVYKPIGANSHDVYDWAPWKPYTSKEDRIYDKEEVFDVVAIHNRVVPEWIRRNVIEHKKVVLHRAGAWAMVDPKHITYLD